MVIKSKNQMANAIGREMYESLNNKELVAEVEYRSVIIYDGARYDAATEKSIAHTKAWSVAFNPAYPNMFNREENPAVLLEGRMPSAAEEVAISAELFAEVKADGHIAALGDTLLRNVSSEMKEVDGKMTILRTFSPFTVVGILDTESLEPPYRDLSAYYKRVLVHDYDALSARFDAAESNELHYDTIYEGLDTEICSGYDVIYRLHSMSAIRYTVH